MSYQEHKARVRAQAFKYLALYDKGISLSYYAVWCWQVYFTKQARKYGLVCEFKENGII